MVAQSKIDIAKLLSIKAVLIYSITRIMQVGEISFCDKVAFNIKSDEVKGRILKALEKQTGFRVIQKHYEKFAIKQHQISQMPHLLSVRTNGNPYLLYLTKYNFENQVIFVDKKIQQGYFYPRMILAKLWFDPSLFDNTLLDGEMVKTSTGSWHFLINDIISLRGEVLNHVPLPKRLSILYDILKNFYTPDDLNTCHLFIKRYFRISEHAEMLDKFAPTLPYSCRGIYLKPFYLKFKDILYNFDDTLIKKDLRVKLQPCVADVVVSSKTESSPSHLQQHTQQQSSSEAPNMPTAPTMPKEGTRQMYLRKTSTPDVYEIEEVKGHALINKLQTSNLLNGIFKYKNINDKVLFHCEYDDKFKKWKPVHAVEQ
jgi:hypothetical protein